MAFKFDGNTFARAIQAVLKAYEGYSNQRVVVSQSVEGDEDDSIFGILDANGYEEYRRNCLDDIAYVVFKIRGIEWLLPLKTKLQTAQLDRVVSMLKEEK